MDLTELQLNRNLQKDTTQVASTQGAIYTATNPSTPANQPNNYSDVGAPDVLTGTVITSCFIQTSALPYRMTLQNNELTLYDDTTERNGTLIGNASRIVFTHDSATKTGVVTSGFILQKRALSTNTYDNVLELFSPDNSPNSNYIFIGRMGTGDERNIRDIDVNVNHITATGNADGFTNGVFRVRVSRDGVNADLRDGMYIIDRASVDSSSNDGSLCWLVGGGPNGQVRLTYIADRSTNPSTATIELQVGALGVRMFGLPSSVPGDAHTVWNNNGVLNIGPGGGGGGTLTLTLTGTPASGATSMTFSPAISGLPTADYYLVAFNGSGEVRSIFMNNGSTTVSWTYPLQTGAGTNQVTVHLS